MDVYFDTLASTTLLWSLLLSKVVGKETSESFELRDALHGYSSRTWCQSRGKIPSNWFIFRNSKYKSITLRGFSPSFGSMFNLTLHVKRPLLIREKPKYPKLTVKGKTRLYQTIGKRKSEISQDVNKWQNHII